MSKCYKIQDVESGRFFDLPNNFSISHNKNPIKLKDNVIETSLAFSGSLLPTQHNMSLFDCASPANKEIKQELEVLIYESECVYEASLKFVSCNSSRIDVVIKRSVNDWLRQISECKLSEVDLGTHIFNPIQSINNNYYVYDGSNPIFYNLNNYGNIYHCFNFQETSDTVRTCISECYFRPQISLLALLEALFCKVGYRLKGDILNNEFFKRIALYLFPKDFGIDRKDELNETVTNFDGDYSGLLTPLLGDLSTKKGFEVTDSGAIDSVATNITTGTDTNIYEYNYTYDSGSKFDGCYNECGTVNIDLNFSFEVTSVQNPQFTFGVQLYRGSDVFKSFTFDQNQTGTINYSDSVCIDSFDACDICVRFIIELPATVQPGVAFIEVTSGSVVFTGVRRFMNVGDSFTAGDIIQSDYEAIDFLKGVLHAFNLCMLPDEKNRCVELLPQYPVNLESRVITDCTNVSQIINTDIVNNGSVTASLVDDGINCTITVNNLSPLFISQILLRHSICLNPTQPDRENVYLSIFFETPDPYQILLPIAVGTLQSNNPAELEIVLPKNIPDGYSDCPTIDGSFFIDIYNDTLTQLQNFVNSLNAATQVIITRTVCLGKEFEFSDQGEIQPFISGEVTNLDIIEKTKEYAAETSIERFCELSWQSGDEYISGQNNVEQEKFSFSYDRGTDNSLTSNKQNPFFCETDNFNIFQNYFFEAGAMFCLPVMVGDDLIGNFENDFYLQFGGREGERVENKMSFCICPRITLNYGNLDTNSGVASGVNNDVFSIVEFKIDGNITTEVPISTMTPCLSRDNSIAQERLTFDYLAAIFHIKKFQNDLSLGTYSYFANINSFEFECIDFRKCVLIRDNGIPMYASIKGVVNFQRCNNLPTQLLLTPLSENCTLNDCELPDIECVETEPNTYQFTISGDVFWQRYSGDITNTTGNNNFAILIVNGQIFGEAVHGLKLICNGVFVYYQLQITDFDDVCNGYEYVKI